MSENKKQKSGNYKKIDINKIWKFRKSGNSENPEFLKIWKVRNSKIFGISKFRHLEILKFQNFRIFGNSGFSEFPDFSPALSSASPPHKNLPSSPRNKWS